MCGIFGAVSSLLVQAELKALKDLMIMTQVRGRHGSGYIEAVRVRNKPNNSAYSVGDKLVFNEKSEKNGSDFVDSMEFDVNHFSQQAIIGHCRHATVGNLDKQAAHPFAVGNYIGVHNGTFEGTYPYKKKSVSDSQAFYRTLARHKGDAVSAIKAFTARTTSEAYCFVWYDLDKSAIKIIRNTARTMWLAKSGGESTVWFGSEAGLLKAATERRKIHLSTEPYMLEPFHLVTIPQGQPNNMSTTDLSEELKPKGTAIFGHRGGHRPVNSNNPITPVKSAIVPYRGHGHTVYHDPIYGPRSAELTKTTNKSTVVGWLVHHSSSGEFTPCQHKLLKNGKTVKVSGAGFPVSLYKGNAHASKAATNDLFYETNEGRIISQKEFLEMTEKGCVYCGSVPTTSITPEKAEGFHFFVDKDQGHLCEECHSEPHVRGWLLYDQTSTDQKRGIN